MAKFCGKCGARLDEKTGLCPNCGAGGNAQQPAGNQSPVSSPGPKKPDKQQKKADKKAAKQQKKTNRTPRQKAVRLLLKIVLILLAALILAVVTLGTLVYFDLVHLDLLPTLPGDDDAGGGSAYTEESARQFAEESKSVDYHEQTGTLYVNNRIIVVVQSGVGSSAMQSLAQEYEATVDESMADIGIYALCFDQSLSYRKLEERIEEIKQNDFVKDAYFDMVVELQPDTESTAAAPPDVVYPDDPWDGASWDTDAPRGANWGVEAIHAPEAWAYLNRMQTVRVGLIDTVPDSSHEDLDCEKYTNIIIDDSTGDIRVSNTSVAADDHGTHVSATIDAQWNNTGVSGVMGGKGELYYCGVYFETSEGEIYSQYGTAYTYLLALKTLIEDDVQVINISQNTWRLRGFAASHGNRTAIDYLTQQANLASAGLSRIIDSRTAEEKRDFVICVAAGNSNDTYYYKDDDAPYGYREEMTWGETILSLFGWRGEKGGSQARYNNFLSLISDPTVMDHIIVVGAIQIDEDASTDRTTVYDYCAFSNVGDRVDVVAPGYDIYSAVVGGYDYMSGTSMAAPHVTGIAGLLFALDPDSTAATVKAAICNTAQNSYGEGDYPLANAQGAVEQMVTYLQTNSPGQFSPDQVPEGAVEWNGHYYYAYPAEVAGSWEEALAYCREQGGYLATITSREEDQFLSSYLPVQGYETAAIGLSDTGDGWQWNTGEEYDYSNWSSDDGACAILTAQPVEHAAQSAAATSTLTEGETVHSADRLLDDDLTTAWVEGAEGQGEGTELTVRLNGTYLITGLEIWAGYQKNDEVYQNNSRPQTVTLTFPDGSSEQFTLEDTRGRQVLELTSPVTAYAFTLRIDSVYPGAVYADTAITELAPLAYDTDGQTWSAGEYSECAAFVCEWGAYQPAEPLTPVRASSDKRDIVLVLDVSGSMDGTPIAETRQAASHFVTTILGEEASVGVVTYDDSANMLSDFSMDSLYLQQAVTDIYSGGNTNMESGLLEAEFMLENSHAEQKIIVLMSDGKPNVGKVGEDLIAYADALKDQGITLYTLGFFESLDDKSEAQALMEQLASSGCHYEVADADDLVFFFGDIADQINGQKYIYIRIACPVDVSVYYNGETLDSSEDDLQTRTSFGSLTFEQGETDGESEEAADSRIKILRLKEGEPYDIHIQGTGRGKMDYTIGFMDDDGNYSDLRTFPDIRITRRTVVDTVAANTDTTELKVDEDGDGKYDLTYRAEAGGTGKLVDYTFVFYIAAAAALILAAAILVLIIRRRRKKAAEQS